MLSWEQKSVCPVKKGLGHWPLPWAWQRCKARPPVLSRVYAGAFNGVGHDVDGVRLGVDHGGARDAVVGVDVGAGPGRARGDGRDVAGRHDPADGQGRLPQLLPRLCAAGSGLPRPGRRASRTSLWLSGGARWQPVPCVGAPTGARWLANTTLNEPDCMHHVRLSSDRG